NAPHTGVAGGPGELRQHADPPQEREQKAELQNPATEHRPGERADGWIEIRRQPEREGYERKIEQRGGQGRDGKPAPRIENSRAERGQGYEQDVRKGDPKQVDRDCELVGICRETGRADVDDDRRGENAEDRDGDQRYGEQGRDPIDKVPRLLITLRVLV